MQTSLLFDEPSQPGTTPGLVGGIISVRAVYNGGSGITTAKVLESFECFHLVEILDFLKGELSSKFQIVDADRMLCLRPGDEPTKLKSDFMGKYDPNTYESKLKSFMQLI